MKKTKITYGLISLICIAAFVLISVYITKNPSSDILMPSCYIYESMASWYALPICLLIEAVFVKLFLKESYLKSALITLVMNIVTLVIGFIALPLIGLFAEIAMLPFNTPTFHISHWVLNFLLISFFNTTLESFTAKLFFKHGFKKVFWKLYAANATSLAIAILLVENLFTENLYF